MKKLASLVLALALWAALAVPALAADFSDVPSGHPFYDAVMDCAGKGITGGYGDGTFRPASTVTRSNFCVMLSRAFYAGDIAKYNNDYNQFVYGPFAGNYLALFYGGAFEGASFEGDFSMLNLSVMNQGISRYDMARLMTNIMNARGFSASGEQKAEAGNAIADYGAIPEQYKDAVANVYALGIIGGYGDGSFRGTVTMNRGQAAVVIYRMAQYIPAETPEIPAETPEPQPEPETPAQPQPEPEPQPETPAAAGTLANGEAITEDNVTAILKQLEAKYPNKTSFASGYSGLGSGRNGNNNCIKQVTSKYKISNGLAISTTAGCGGWAAFVCDEVFGQTNVTWKKTTLSNIRPGDLMIKVDDAGYAMHVQVYVGPVSGFTSNQKVRVTGATSGGTGAYGIGWANCVTLDVTYDVYTAYPD